MNLTLEVSNHREGPTPSAWYRPAYRCFDRDATIYGLVGLHWIVRLTNRWQRHRWTLERVAMDAGFFDLDEGGYWRDGRWTLAFWRTRERRIRQRHSRHITSLDAYVKREYERGLKDGEEALIARVRAEIKRERDSLLPANTSPITV